MTGRKRDLLRRISDDSSYESLAYWLDYITKSAYKPGCLVKKDLLDPAEMGYKDHRYVLGQLQILSRDSSKNLADLTKNSPN